MSGQVRGLLGFAMRMGHVTVGAAQALELAARGRAALVLVDRQAADNTRRKLLTRCHTAGVPVRALPAGVLGQAIGRPQALAAALKPGQLADRLAALLPDTGNDEPRSGNLSTAEAIN